MIADKKRREEHISWQNFISPWNLKLNQLVESRSNRSLELYSTIGYHSQNSKDYQGKLKILESAYPKSNSKRELDELAQPLVVLILPPSSPICLEIKSLSLHKADKKSCQRHEQL
jgi:hypothetical protein